MGVLWNPKGKGPHWVGTRALSPPSPGFPWLSSGSTVLSVRSAFQLIQALAPSMALSPKLPSLRPARGLILHPIPTLRCPPLHAQTQCLFTD